MNLRKAITKDGILLGLNGSTKGDVIDELLDFMVETGKISDRKAAYKAVSEREKKMSTGMHHGIAIPHGKTDTVNSLVAVIGVKKEGIDFDALDKELSRIFVMTVSPANRAGPHIQFLAEISRLLNEEAVRDRIVAAESVEDIYNVVIES